jgi:hypothetical protein
VVMSDDLDEIRFLDKARLPFTEATGQPSLR